MSQTANPEGAATYLSQLFEQARRAREAGDPAAFWRMSHRIVELTEMREAGPLLLRAEALALLGDAAGAAEDVRRAFRVDPAFDGLAQALLMQGSVQERMAVALHRLRAKPDVTAPMASLLAEAGHAGLILTEAREAEAGHAGATVFGSVYWQGAAQPQLTLSVEGRASIIPVPLVDQPHEAMRSATFRLDWPEGARYISLRAPGFLAIPPGLVAPQGPRLPACASAPHSRMMVIVPAYGDWPALARCLRSVIAALAADMRLVVVDDASPDAELRASLAAMAEEHRFALIRNPVNLGFAGAVNEALARRGQGEDVLLLNSDATLPPDALRRLCRLAGREPDIGTLTPLSNNGEELSLPRRFLLNAEPDDAMLARIDAAAEAANGDRLIEMPNGVGFCLYIRAPLIDRIGGLAGCFERGYFEDVEFCLRAHAAGFRNLAAPGLYVAHAGSRSFGTEKRAYVRRNLEKLRARHPNYQARSDAFFAEDPLREATHALQHALLSSDLVTRVLIAPADCGQRYARTLAAPFAPDVLLRPVGEGVRVQALAAGFAFDLELEGEELHRFAASCASMPTREIRLLDAPDIPDSIRALWPMAAPLPSFRKDESRNTSSRPLPAMNDNDRARPGIIGVFAPDMLPAMARALLAHATAHPELRYVLLDPLPLEVEMRLCRAGSISASGGISDAELARYAAQAGLTAFLFIDPAYGRCDERRGQLETLGLAVLDASGEL